MPSKLYCYRSEANIEVFKLILFSGLHLTEIAYIHLKERAFISLSCTQSFIAAAFISDGIER